MGNLLEFIHASWMKGKEGNIAKDMFSLRQFTYNVGDGKELVDVKKQKLREYTFESLCLFLSGTGSITQLTRKQYEDGEEVFSLKIFVIPDENDIWKAKATGDFVVYDQNGNMTHKPNFELGLGNPERIYDYGFPTLSSCPEKVDFKKTVDRFIKQARKSEFHNPRLFKVKGRLF